MFKLDDKIIIGQYLKKLIDEKFKNQSNFCKAYISSFGREVNEEEIKNMENRLSQMIKGKKSIQTYDLPIFTKLLDVTCEEILSAGKTFVQKNNRLTNYGIAFSKDKNLWEEYINHDDKPFLNPDEYCKTVLDYAIEFNNFDFIKYLIDKRIIWFGSMEFNSFIHVFGAGTSIKGRNIGEVDYYLPQQLCNDKLRMKLVAFSIQNNSLEILHELRAREIPDYYNSTYFVNSRIEISKYYNKELITDISAASDEIIDYFTDVFEIGNLIQYEDGIERKHKFTFPFISEVLDELIKNNNGFAEFALRKSIEHNRETYHKLKALVNRIVESETVRFDDHKVEYFNEMKKSITKQISEDINIDESEGIIALNGNSTERGLITNIIQVKNESEDITINYMIKELNALYNQIVHIRDEFKM